MFVKLFEQIFDSSISEDFQVRLVFEDLLILADVDGVVDMTHEAISRRTNVPIEIVKRAISVLESPDLKSRRPDSEGRRIIRIDDHRDWGWMITNYGYYRGLASELQRREKTRDRVNRHRSGCNAPVTQCNAPVTQCNAPVTQCNAPVTKCNDSPSASASPSALHPEGNAKGRVTQSTYSESFDAFWAAYPKKVAKNAAWKAWSKADLPAIDVIIASIKDQSATEAWRKDRGQFIPNPATWINAGRWMDETKIKIAPKSESLDILQKLDDDRRRERERAGDFRVMPGSMTGGVIYKTLAKGMAEGMKP